MNKMHFENLRDWKLVSILIISAILLILGIFEPFEFISPEIYDKILPAGFLLQIIYTSRIFWYKNYVQWNKLGMTLKINSFFGKHYSFDQISGVEMNTDTLTITKTNGTKTAYNIAGMEKRDALQLQHLILERSSTNK
tara:strand:- start:574 stop:987 length:414 start_codon:yes stop_codon:yes gene_type:complete